jgi:hypothetical protein
MTRSQRDLFRVLLAIAHQNEAKLIEIAQTNGGHKRAIFRARTGAEVSLICANTASDWRASRNVEALARRLLR